jgi:YVTN family beta-propeller protein
VANTGSNNVSVIDVVTNSVTASIPAGDVPGYIAVSPDGTKIYVTNWRSNNLSVINTLTNTVTASVSVGNEPRGVAVTPDGKKVYVANSASYSEDYEGNVSVIDTATNTVTATVNTRKYTMNCPVGVVIGPFTNSHIADQSARTTPNTPGQSQRRIFSTTEDTGVEETNFSFSEDKNSVELNNSGNNNSETNNGSILNLNNSSENESEENNFTPGFGLLGGLICLYGSWKFRKE